MDYKTTTIVLIERPGSLMGFDPNNFDTEILGPGDINIGAIDRRIS
jgi:hypothetical protein